MTGFARKLLVTILPPLVLSGTWAVLSTSFTLDAGDFPAFYTGAVIALRGDFKDLHNERLQIEIQKPLTPARALSRATLRCVLRFTRRCFAPFALLPIRPSFVCFVILHAAVLIACWYWAYKRFGPDAVTLAALFPAAIMSFAFGQDVVLFLGLFVLSYYLFEQDRPLLSGFVLGLAFIKPHLMFLIPLVLIIQRRWANPRRPGAGGSFGGRHIRGFGRFRGGPKLCAIPAGPPA